MKVNLPAFERAGVMVVGDVMLDRYWYGPTCRISPEAPVPVVKVNTVEERPGGAANVAMNIASLGANARLVGLTGIDDAARALSKTLAEVNVKCDFVSVPTHPTITKLRVLSRNQQLIRLDFEEGFEAVAGKCKSEDELVERGMKLIADYDLSALLVTRSEQGMTLLQPNKAPLHMPTQAQEVYDVTGAGDTVIGVLAATLAAGNTLEEACYFANAAAGVVVGKLGTSTVSPIELENAVRGRADTGFGVMTEEELRQAVASARKRGEKVVMTNGVFDILHAGHVSYLANARKLGDRLIVAVNSDASTKRLKGESRPVNPLEQRMIVLGALESVDWVVSFEEDTPQRLIAGILPDLLVKGGDYKPEEIAGSEEVWANGGEVMVLNFEDGCSTTNIIKKIQTESEK